VKIKDETPRNGRDAKLDFETFYYGWEVVLGQQMDELERTR
jgi:hypothetical protein